MDIQSRSAAGLPPVPSSVGRRSLSSWTGIKVHHTGGPFSSWRSIYDWQVLNRPAGERLVDIGYSFGIADGRVTALRGWDRSPAHDHENSTLGVVFGGNYSSRLPPAEDLAVFVAFVRHAREKTGRPLPVTGHRDTWPRGDRRYSTCPGDRLYAELPRLRRRIDDEEDDVSAQDVWEYRMQHPTTGGHLTAEERVMNTAINVHRMSKIVPELAAEVAAIRAGQAGGDQTAAFRAELDRHRALLLDGLGEDLVDAVRAELGEVPDEVAEAVGRALDRVRVVVEPDGV